MIIYQYINLFELFIILTNKNSYSKNKKCSIDDCQKIINNLVNEEKAVRVKLNGQCTVFDFGALIVRLLLMKVRWNLIMLNASCVTLSPSIKNNWDNWVFPKFKLISQIWQIYLICLIFLPIIAKLKKIGPLVLGSFGMKSAGFHGGIWWISWPWIPPWNLPDFMKSAKFHGHEIWQISWWNPVDFMAMKSGRVHEIQWISPTTPLSSVFMYLN